MGTLHDITSGAQIERTRFGEFLDARINNGLGVAWDTLPQNTRRMVAAVAGVALGAVAPTIVGLYDVNKDAAAHPAQDEVLCLPETTFTAKSGDTLSEKGEDRLKELKKEANGEDVPVGNVSGTQVREYQLANELLNGVEGIERGTEYKLGRVCVVAAEDGTLAYAVVQQGAAQGAAVEK